MLDKLFRNNAAELFWRRVAGLDVELHQFFPLSGSDGQFALDLIEAAVGSVFAVEVNHLIGIASEGFAVLSAECAGRVGDEVRIAIPIFRLVTMKESTEFLVAKGFIRPEN